MFGNSKEYQDIKKLYEEKVSKPENINEITSGLGPIPKVNSTNNVKVSNTNNNAPNTSKNIFQKIGDVLRGKPIVGSRSRFNTKDKLTTTGMSNIPKGEGSAVIDGKKINPNFGKEVKIDTSKGPDVIEPENQSREFGPGGQPSASVQIKKSRLSGKTGKERAQELAKMRIGSGTAKNPDTTIQDLKDANTKSMRERAKARFEKFKAEREAKRLARLNKEDYTSYDMVLEYLMSTQQATTIEEANYVMMQLDEENIQEIVKFIMKTPLVKLVPAAGAAIVGTKMIASKMGQKSGENEIQQSTTPVPVPDKNKKKGNFITNFINKRRNQKGGGNYRVDEVEKNAGVEPGYAGEKIKF